MTESWILEVRRRLAAAPPRAVAGDGGGNGRGAGAAAEEAAEGPRAAALVPLFVDAGELWTLLTVRAAPRGRVAPMAFPGSVLTAGEDPWPAAVRGGEEEAGLAPEVVLDLGRLPPATTPAGVVIVPCVGAVPAPAVDKRTPPRAAAAVVEVVPLPLSALADPSLVEAQPVEIDGVAGELAIYHVGRHRLWGATARIAGSLLARLGLGGPMAAPPAG
ncbi:MAG TPA: NUDIX domain-containing protein [Thermoanaerobaculia bacterium]